MVTFEQIQEQANAIALQADALANGQLDRSTLYAQVRLIAENARTLEVWTADLTPEPVSQHRVSTPDPASADPGYCKGCGRTYKGAAGLRAHQARPFLALGCQA